MSSIFRGTATRFWPNSAVRMFGRSLNVATLVLLGGCINLGPDYERPTVEVEPDWLLTEEGPVSSAAPVSEVWWQQVFKDPDLDKLIDLSIAQNLTLRSAGLRVLQSQQQLAIAVGGQYPQQQQLSGNASRQKSDEVIFNDYNVGFNLTWEVDFWGRFRRQVETASAQLDASVASYDAVLVSLVAQVAQTYILIRTFQERIDLARLNAQLQAESVRISKAKVAAGDVSELDVDQAESLLYNTQATVFALETSLQQFKNNLAVLLGKPPQDMNYLLTQMEVIPTAPASVALGMPQDLIRRRPDIRVSERQLAAQSARIGVAEADLYPSLSIGGSIGTSSMQSGSLFENQSETWDVFGAFQWNIFNYGRLQSNVRLQDALFQQLLADYRGTVLQAQAEVENAIVAYIKSQEQLASYRLAAEASQRAVEVSSSQYKNGLVSFNTVVSTLSSNTQQQDLLASTQGTVASNLVEVFKSLGGGWEVRGESDPVDLLPASTKEQMRERTGAWKGVLE